MPYRIVGRDAERARISEWLASRTAAASAVVIGPAGTGKTALWDWAVGEAAGPLLASDRAGRHTVIAQSRTRVDDLAESSSNCGVWRIQGTDRKVSL